MRALAKTADRNEALEATQMCARIAQIVQDEFGGDICAGIWLAAARRAAERIMEAGFTGNTPRRDLRAAHEVLRHRRTNRASDGIE